MGKQRNNPYRRREPVVNERQGNGRRAMRNMVRWRNRRATGKYNGRSDVKA